jgi:DNA-binding NtrC family response regulator
MPSLLAASGSSAGACFDVSPAAVIGRSPSCEVSLHEDSKVSRRHARLDLRGEDWYVVDLESRNGTLLNGTQIAGEARLLPGDRLLVGDTLFVFDPPATAVVVGQEQSEPSAGAIEEFLPAAGELAQLFRAATALLGCPSQAAALSRGAEEAMRLLQADAAAALVPSDVGFATSAVVGAPQVEVPRPLIKAAAERREGARTERAAAAPIWAGGNAFGVLYVQRHDEPITDRELGLLGMLGRLCGETVTAARAQRRHRGAGSLVGTSRAFRRVVDQARRAAAGSLPVVLHGEAGTGKSMLADYVHSRSTRALGPLVKVDCRAPLPVLEEDLFGRSAMPGAPPSLPAVVRADGGTLVLVGVEALPRELSKRLSKALREKRSPASDGGDGRSDFRLVVTCRRPPGDLAAAAVLEGELAASLEGVEIGAIPLRDHRSDVQQLFDLFCGQAARVWGGGVPTLSPEAREALLSYEWPGNVRELRLCAERIAQVCSGAEVLPGHLPREIGGGGELDAVKLSDLVSRVEREAIVQALRKARGKKIRAAELLGISRPTLDKKLALYRIAVK